MSKRATSWEWRPQFLYSYQKRGVTTVYTIQPDAGGRRYMVLPFKTAATDLGRFVTDHKHGQLKQFGALRLALQYVRKKHGGVWHASSCLIRTRRVASDFAIMTVAPVMGRWLATAVVTPRLGSAALVEHGHEIVGTFDDPLVAMRAADRYKPGLQNACECAE